MTRYVLAKLLSCIYESAHKTFISLPVSLCSYPTINKIYKIIYLLDKLSERYS